MQLEDLVILLPCYSLEDLPLDWTADEAHSLLSAWSGLYHPALLVAANRTPRWLRADDPPPETSGRLIAVPQCCETRLPTAWLEEAGKAGACVLRNISDRVDLIRRALVYVNPDVSRLDPVLAEDFLALGFCHLQVELLTRQLRYMSNLDTDSFQRETVAVAKKALEGENQAARDGLRSVFELLADARGYYYPAEAHLLDLTLVVPTTAGAALREELSGNTPVNLLLSGETLHEISRQEPSTLDAIKAGQERGHVTIVGGEFQEMELPLMPVKAIVSQFERGLAAYEKLLGRRPVIFGRRRFGLTPALPGILRDLGFTGALHFTLDDGRFPSGKQSKIRWQGCDASEIEALARLPIDAAKSEQFFKLPEKLGNTLDIDQAATVVFAHWPGRVSPWYRDLQRMGGYSRALGRFLSMHEYFEKTQTLGSTQRYSADEYRSPYLRQTVAAGQSDPISRWVRYHRVCSAAETLQSLATLHTLVDSQAGDDEETQRLIDEAANIAPGPGTRDADLQQRVERRLDERARRAAASISGQPKSTPAQSGYLLLNPWSFPRRMSVDVTALPRPASTEGAVWRCGETDGRKVAVVDVPGMGFAWVGAGAESDVPRKPSFWTRTPKKVELPSLAERHVLRNEYFEATIDPITGAIRSICLHNTRGNRLAQQLAMRIPGPPRSKNVGGEENTEQDYSIMAADRVTVSADALVGRIECRGRLVDRNGQPVARFIQNMAVRRGSRILELDIELDILREPDSNPWDSYYAVRFAWGSAEMDLRRSIHGTSRASEAVLLEAPQFIDLRSAKSSTTILTGGLPYHRRFGSRKLDTLLIVKGETSRRFRLGIGIDLMYPVPAAIDLTAPPVVERADRPPSGAVGWFFHLDARNVMATDWQPLISQREVVGYRATLLETEGRAAQVGLRSFRPVASARRLHSSGQDSTVLPVQDDRVTISVTAYQSVTVEAHFKS